MSGCPCAAWLPHMDGTGCPSPRPTGPLARQPAVGRAIRAPRWHGLGAPGPSRAGRRARYRPVPRLLATHLGKRDAKASPAVCAVAAIHSSVGMLRCGNGKKWVRQEAIARVRRHHACTHPAVHAGTRTSTMATPAVGWPGDCVMTRGASSARCQIECSARTHSCASPQPRDTMFFGGGGMPFGGTPGRRAQRKVRCAVRSLLRAVHVSRRCGCAPVCAHPGAVATARGSFPARIQAV